jgi:hypothetical protein
LRVCNGVPRKMYGGGRGRANSWSHPSRFDDLNAVTPYRGIPGNTNPAQPFPQQQQQQFPNNAFNVFHPFQPRGFFPRQFESREREQLEELERKESVEREKKEQKKTDERTRKLMTKIIKSQGKDKSKSSSSSQSSSSSTSSDDSDSQKKKW